MTTIVTKNEYDHRGRLTAIKHKIGSQDTVTVAAYSYNELGQLIGKSLGKKAAEPDYVSNATIRYNERGWLKTSTAGSFSQQLNYQDGTNPQWNGNISQQLWGTTSTPLSTFSYQYDRLDRLSSGTATGMSEAMLYDDMGNITKLTRDATDINYSYVGNRLSSLSGGLSGSYTYDANGNALTDRMGMTLTYNQLNLPATANKSGTSLSYLYDALGNKLRKTAVVSSVTTVREYVGGIEYNGANIDIIHFPEGYALKSGATYVYHHNLTDHLGNVRATLKRGATPTTVDVVQRDDYYPFGKRKVVMGGINKYLYNGKEIQGELGDQYDYGARFYDAEIGRWNVTDPMAEMDRAWSPYNYARNNPIRFIDPDGMFWGDFLNEDGRKIGTDGKNDGKLYLIKTTQKKFDSDAPFAGITKEEAKETEKFILKNSGNTLAFEINNIAYSNSIEITGSSTTRQSMVDIVNQDNGRGGTDDANNREYGGIIKSDGTVVQSPAGPVSSPANNKIAQINIVNLDFQSTFHSHPSGNIIPERNPNSIGAGETVSSYFRRAPSNIGDVSNSRSNVNYVFSRSNGTVYIYNNTGVIATMPQRYFVTPNQKK